MGGVDKLFVSLSGRPLLAWCVEALEAYDLVVEIVVAVAPERIADARQIASARGWTKTRLVEGGVRRQDSVARGLSALGEIDWVVVHDGDRPFLDARLIESGL
ncbi:MAG: 2-C-methyl-D-erythritol 4-phosphate cytidylyltransferase, partial [Coriobacteriia bacterium]|nr:2-C-methyl-D-erythritol 4-phosphate cytidylyltransferase [Coriobacteriia bacterium]